MKFKSKSILEWLGGIPKKGNFTINSGLTIFVG
jgi:hypothetical protein